MIMALD